MNYLGDFAEDATLYIPFNTFSSDDPSASVTITNLVAADIKVHKDGGTTEIATDGATIAIDYDGITGNHLITIDTSAHSDYAIGSDYLVRVEGTTVDAATINAWVGHFSIENRFVRVDEIAANAITATSINADAITAAKIADAAFVAANFAASSLDGKGDWNTVVPDAAGVAPTAVEVRTEMDSNSTQFVAILADTGNIGVAGAGLTNINLPNQTMDITGDLSGSVGSVTAQVTADVTAIGGETAPATTFRESCNSIHYCTVVGGSDTTVTATISVAVPALIDQADQYNGRQVLFVDGVLQGVQRAITDYSVTTGTATFTVATFPGTPDNPGAGDKFLVF